MSKGQVPKMKGAICNIPVSVNDISTSLPRNVNSSGIVLVKLKKKLEFSGHVYFEPVSPAKVEEALLFLQANNPFYADIDINVDSIPAELLNLDENEDIEIELEVEDDLETTSNPLDNFRQGASESCTFPDNLNNEFVEIAPGENKKPENIMLDKHCEELAFPQLFPLGKYGYQVKRTVELSAVKYFNQRLLNYKNTFSSSPDYIFFAQFVVQQLKLFSEINIAMKKFSGNITAGALTGNFKENVQSLISSNQCFTFMNNIKGSPSYWKKFQSDILAMIRQLG